MSAHVNLIVEQGSNFYQELNLSDENGDALIVDEANDNPLYISSAQMRKSFQASNGVTFDTDLANGMLILTLTAEDTANIVAGRYVYSVELTGTIDGNTVSRIVEGIVTVTPTAIK